MYIYITQSKYLDESLYASDRISGLNSKILKLLNIQYPVKSAPQYLKINYQLKMYKMVVKLT